MFKDQSDDRTFFQVGATCAAISAVTTALLWGLPFLQDDALDPNMLYQDAAYIGRLWVNLVHVILALIGYIAIAGSCRHTSPGFALGAVTFLTIWAALEASGVSIALFAVNGTWRPALAAAATIPAERETIEAVLSAWTAIWDGLFFVILSTFLVGTLLLGLAMRDTAGRLPKVCSILLLAAVPLTVLIMAGGYWGQEWANSATQILYPVLQPVSRLCLALFLFRVARYAYATDSSREHRNNLQVLKTNI